MRKAFILLFALLALKISSAQDFRFGLTASPEFNFPRILDEDISSGGVYLGLNYGLLVDLTLGNNERYAFHTGLTHRLAGINLDDITRTSISGGDTVVYEASQKLKLQYVEIPLTIRLRTNEIGYITYYGQMGFVPGIVVSSRYDQKSPNEAFAFNNRENDNSVGVNLALQIGGGIEYSLGGATSLMAGLYYNNGFTNMYKPSYIDDKVSLRNIGLRLGVLF